MLIQKGPFAGIRCALEVLERVACSIKFNEPILLVGETGTGKTTTVQNLAAWLKQPLTVVVWLNSNINNLILEQLHIYHHKIDYYHLLL